MMMDNGDSVDLHDDDSYYEYTPELIFLISITLSLSIYIYIYILDFSTFITSIVLNNDIICRLNFINLCNLRQLVLELISRSKVNKMIILQAMFRNYNLNDLIYSKGNYLLYILS